MVFPLGAPLHMSHSLLFVRTQMLLCQGSPHPRMTLIADISSDPIPKHSHSEVWGARTSDEFRDWGGTHFHPYHMVNENLVLPS